MDVCTMSAKMDRCWFQNDVDLVSVKNNPNRDDGDPISLYDYMFYTFNGKRGRKRIP